MLLGQMLVEERAIRPDQLEEALAAQVVHGGRLGTNLVELGYLTEEQLARALGRKHKMPFAHGDIVPSQAALGLVHPNIADDKDVIPLRVDGNRLYLGVINPDDIATIDRIGLTSSKRVVPVILPEFRMAQLLRRYCHAYRPVREVDIEAVRRRKASEAQQRPASQDLMAEDEFESLYAAAMSGGPSDEGLEEAEIIEDLPAEPVQPPAWQVRYPTGVMPAMGPPSGQTGRFPTPAQVPARSGPWAGQAAPPQPAQPMPPQAWAQPQAPQTTQPMPPQAWAQPQPPQTTQPMPPQAWAQPGQAPSTPQAYGPPPAAWSGQQVPQAPTSSLGQPGWPAQPVTQAGQVPNPVWASPQAADPSQSQAGSRAPARAAPAPWDAPVAPPPQPVAQRTQPMQPHAAALPPAPRTQPMPQCAPQLPPAAWGQPPQTQHPQAQGWSYPQPPAQPPPQAAWSQPAPAQPVAPPQPIPLVAMAPQPPPQPAPGQRAPSYPPWLLAHMNAGPQAAQAPVAPPPAAQAVSGAPVQREEPRLPMPAERPIVPAPLAGAAAPPAFAQPAAPPPAITASADPLLAAPWQLEPPSEPEPAAPVPAQAFAAPPAPASPAAGPPPQPIAAKKRLSVEIDDSAPFTFADAQKALASVTDRDDIARIVLRFAAGKYARTLLLNVQKDMVTGWHGAGRALPRAAARRIGISLKKPSPFKLVRDSRSHFLGPLRREFTTVTFLRALGGEGEPKTAVMMPILAAGRVVHILYGDNGPDKFASPDVGELLILAQKVGRSYEAMIAARKKVGAAPAP